MATRAVPLAFSYEHLLEDQADAYERLLADAIAGRQTLFARQDGVEECWRIVAPALEAPRPVHHYAQGSWGPVAADGLSDPFGVWHEPQVSS
jgi:glucose-6-phosphate 1-dehydrogenase